MDYVAVYIQLQSILRGMEIVKMELTCIYEGISTGE